MARRGAIVVTALCAALLVVPQVATAGKAKRSYEGPVATQAVFGPPTIQLKIQFKRKDGKLVPDSLANLKHRAIPLFCPNGSSTFLGPFNLESGEATGFAQPGFIGSGVKKGKLRFTLHGEDVDSMGASPTALLALRGRIPRRGAVTGTIHIVDNVPSRGGNCDSGVVGFTAPRVAALSPAS